ncbi:hypothetical protein HMPREF9554_02472 [Treponema phagedenis F0421]|nr:hypothetical protein HMPREF9554_02472 [Treponema phagedenis F0421]
MQVCIILCSRFDFLQQIQPETDLRGKKLPAINKEGGSRYCFHLI